MRLPAIPAPVYPVLWERLDLGPMPFPLALRTQRRTGAAQREEAADWLTGNALGDSDHLDFGLVQALRAMAGVELVTFALYSDASGQTRVGCFPTASGRALRATLRGGMLELGWMHARRVADGTLDVLPNGGPGQGRPMWLDGTAMTLAMVAWRRIGRRSEAVKALTRGGIPPGEAERLLGRVAGAYGIGRISAIRRRAGRGDASVAAYPVTFVDGHEGRYVIASRYRSHALLPACEATMQARINALPDGPFVPPGRAPITACG